MIVFLSTFFLSGADPLHNFGTRWEMVQENARLVWLIFTGDVGQGVVWLLCSLIFFRAWRLNRHSNVWYSDIHWQISGIFFCWFLQSILSLISNFYSFLWMQGMIRLFVFVFGFYFLNTLFAARKMIYHPKTSDEVKEMMKKYDEILKKLNDG